MIKALLAISFVVVSAASSDARSSRSLQARYCAGMAQEQYVRLGGRADCLNDEYAIEVEWVHDWYHAVGQALYYAVATDKKPAIILLCPGSDVENEGRCRNYIYRLAAALELVSVPVRVWECFPEDMSLAACFEPDMSP